MSGDVTEATGPAPVPLKILLGAFACAPGLGSEEGVGWGIASALARSHRVHVLTTRRHREVIERHLAAHPVPQLSFSYIDFHPALLRCVIHTVIWQLYFHAWQLRIGEWARSVAADFCPDIVHQVTYGRYWTPSTLWRLGRPFVWGPLGGGDQCPPAFMSCLSWRERFVERARNLAQKAAHFDPWLRATAGHCDLALASTPATAERLQELGCHRVTQLLQMAVEETLSEPHASEQHSNELIFCTAGRLLGWKAHALAIRAFAAAALPGSRLIIMGTGPNKKKLSHLARSLGVDGSVLLTGAVSRRITLSWMRRSVALLHPSLHDQAPTVVFEAMASGTPVIGLPLGGLPLQISAGTGFIVSAAIPERTVAEIATAMRKLALDPALRTRLGQAAQLRVASRFTWRHKAAELTALYRDLLGTVAVAGDGPVPRLSPRAEFAAL